MNIEEQLESMNVQLALLGRQNADLRIELSNSKRENREFITKTMNDKVAEISGLRDEAVKVLKLLRDKGIVTREELKEVM